VEGDVAHQPMLVSEN